LGGTPGELAELVGRSGEPDLATDFSYGIRQLTDIAERALSPGVNDPTTAIQVINQLYAVLAPLACRPDLSPYLTDDEGVVRAMYRAPSFAGLICGSLQDIAHYAAESPRVCSRLREVAELLSERAIETHRPSLRRVLASLPPELPSESAPED